MDHKVRLQEYLPEFMVKFRELDALLSAENPEFDLLYRNAQQVMDDFLIETASEAAIARYEKIAGIRPAAGDSLKTRRLRLMLAEGRVERFTIARLIEIAARLGEEVAAEVQPGFRLILEFIAADPENIEILYDEFRASLPAVMEIIVRNVTELPGDTYFGGTLGLSMTYTFTGVD